MLRSDSNGRGKALLHWSVFDIAVLPGNTPFRRQLHVKKHKSATSKSEREEFEQEQAEETEDSEFIPENSAISVASCSDFCPSN